MADEADRAECLIEAERKRNVMAILSQVDDDPIFNDAGIRVCVDCESVIPKRRVESINAVRCVECARIDEIESKRYRS